MWVLPGELVFPVYVNSAIAGVVFTFFFLYWREIKTRKVYTLEWWNGIFFSSFLCMAGFVNVFRVIFIIVDYVK